MSILDDASSQAAIKLARRRQQQYDFPRLLHTTKFRGNLDGSDCICR
jgi:hypothetical protein